jgi:hypothetical protein
LIGRIPLVRLTEFHDKLEGIDIQHLMLNIASDIYSKNLKSHAFGGTLKHIKVNVNPARRNSLRRQRQIFQKTNFATCWYESNHESVAMWQLYSRPDSVAIRIPYKALTTEIVNNNFVLSYPEIVRMRYGSIEYIRFNELNELNELRFRLVNKETQGFIKDTSFTHEREFRIMLEIKPKEEYKVNASWVMLDEQVENLIELSEANKIDLYLDKIKQLPFEIVFHPQSSKWHRENIKKIIDKFDLKFDSIDSELRDIFK